MGLQVRVNSILNELSRSKKATHYCDSDNATVGMVLSLEQHTQIHEENERA